MHVTRTKRTVQVLPSVEAIYSTTAHHLSRGEPISVCFHTAAGHEDLNNASVPYQR